VPRTVRRTFWIALFLLAAKPALAQFETSSIVGTVRDSTAAVVPEANIRLDVQSADLAHQLC
jgi:hypothetical protein